MIGLEPLRWLLTVAFGGASVFHLVRCLRPARCCPPAGEHRISEALHLVMGVSMVMMIWPWGDRFPAAVWMTVFMGSTGWFVARAVRSTGRRLVLGFFASVTAAMVWMGASMPAQAGPRHDGAAMPGMTMAGGSPGVTGWISGILGGYLVLAAFWWVLRGMRISGLATAGAAPQSLGWTSLCHGVMSAGMGLALLTLA